MAKQEVKDYQAMGQAFEALKPLSQEDRVWAIGWLCDKLMVPQETLQPGKRLGEPENVEGGRLKPSTAPKAFVASKAPETDTEHVACLAYFLNQQGIPEFGTKEIRQLATQAAYRGLSNPSVAVDNAKAKGYFVSVGKGKKKLSHFGTLIVEALPDRERVKKVIETNKPRRRKKSRKHDHKAKAK